MSKISIIIPFKNTPLKWMKKLIDSLKNQNNQNFEAIFIDDNSDNPEPYIKLIEKNKYNYYVSPQKDMGVGKLRDFGVTLSTGNFIWFVDSDDWLYRDAINYLLKSFNKYKNIDLIMFEYEWVFKEKLHYDDKCENYQEFISKNIASKSNMPWFHNNYQTDWRVCFKKDFLIKNNINHPDKVNIFEDVYFGLIWKVLFKRILLTSKKIYFYNRLNWSSSLALYRYSPEDLIKIILSNRNYLIKNNIFKEIWYFYALNWLNSLKEMDYQIINPIKLINIHNKFIGNNNYPSLEIIGFHKIWFTYIAILSKKRGVKK